MSPAAVDSLDGAVTLRTHGGDGAGAREDEVDVRQTCDPDEIATVLRDPAVYPHVSDDYAGASDTLDVRPALQVPSMGFLGVYVAGKCVGVVLFVRHSMTVTEIHVALTPRCRGRLRETALRRVVDILITMPGCAKLMTLVPRPHRTGAFAALHAGFVEEGVLTRSFLSGGVLHDQRIFGLTREAHGSRRAAAAADR